MPVNGFSDSGLKKLFSSPASHDASRAGEIAGGVIGGVLILGLIGWFLFKRLRQNDSKSDTPTTSSASNASAPMFLDPTSRRPTMNSPVISPTSPRSPTSPMSGNFGEKQDR
jgi:hypothetical protein